MPNGAVLTFNSAAFLAFLVATFVCYVVVPRRWQNYVLLAASYVFYGSWDPRFVLLLGGYTAIEYFIALRIGSSSTVKARRALIGLSLMVSLGLMVLFKYLNFFLESMRAFAGAAGLRMDMPSLHILLPIGISFYVLQTLGYTIDVYRRKCAPERDFVSFALFVSFFPLLLAGPIERAGHLLPQIHAKRTLSLPALQDGALLMLWGLFKKVVIADNLAGITNMAITSAGFREHVSGVTILLAMYTAAFQIYADFSGYSDMARGCARLLGFEIVENFRSSYLATSIPDFWGRWHISLMSWFRDYVYFSLPLRGGRGALRRRATNVLITFSVCGLWHGAALHYVAWGLFVGTVLVVSNAIPNRRRTPPRWRKLVGWFFVFHMSVVAVFPYDAHGFADGLSAVRRVLGIPFDPLLLARLFSLQREIFEVALLGGGLLLIELVQRRRPHPAAVLGWHPVYVWTATALVLLAIVILGNRGYVPFIYSQY